MNGIMEIRRQVGLSQWSAMVREREESGLSVKAYCKQTGIAAKTYYYRLRRLREAAVEQVRSEATQPELVQFTPPAEYAVGQAQSILPLGAIARPCYWQQAGGRDKLCLEPRAASASVFEKRRG